MDNVHPGQLRKWNSGVWGHKQKYFTILHQRFHEAANTDEAWYFLEDGLIDWEYEADIVDLSEAVSDE